MVRRAPQLRVDFGNLSRGALLVLLAWPVIVHLLLRAIALLRRRRLERPRRA